MSPILVPKLCAIIFPFPKLLKAHKEVLNSTRPFSKTDSRTVFCNFHFSDDQSRWQLLEEGQIIAHFLGRSYDLHIYFGIFCTGCLAKPFTRWRSAEDPIPRVNTLVFFLSVLTSRMHS